MKIGMCIFALGVFTIIGIACADTLYLKNGRTLEGLVKFENDKSVELDVGFGTVTFERAAVEKVERSSPDEIAVILKNWEIERKKSQEMQAKAEEQWKQEMQQWKEKKAIEEIKQQYRPKEVSVEKSEGHLLVDATLNKKLRARLIIDTGASLILLTNDMARRIGVNIYKDGTPVEIQVADGRKLPARYIILSNVRVENVEASDVEAAFFTEEHKDLNIQDGLLGMSFLKRFNFQYDAKGNKLVLERIR
ncbi:MAG: TIGR02281 family clan AA aspartic protease [Candidatus Omnitrophica bacterium]|jgi:clan AA aspartic protease (TIGR02281 family)|nr:TIGR02281 family clan AA aspartic protease [Candidatus Omnitrophota bacterium]